MVWNYTPNDDPSPLQQDAHDAWCERRSDRAAAAAAFERRREREGLQELLASLKSLDVDALDVPKLVINGRRGRTQSYVYSKVFVETSTGGTLEIASYFDDETFPSTRILKMYITYDRFVRASGIGPKLKVKYVLENEHVYTRDGFQDAVREAIASILSTSATSHESPQQ